MNNYITLMGRHVKLNSDLIPRIGAKIRNSVMYIVYCRSFLGGSISSVAEHANPTESSDYNILKWLFSKVDVNKADVIVDVGCGKGRVLLWLINNGYRNKLIGIELNQMVAAETRKKLVEYKNAAIISGNILSNIPPDATLFYLYHPFNRNSMCDFKRQLMLEKKKVTLIYSNSVHIDVFRDDSHWNVAEYAITIPNAGIRDYKAAIITKV